MKISVCDTVFCENLECILSWISCSWNLLQEKIAHNAENHAQKPGCSARGSGRIIGINTPAVAEVIVVVAGPNSVIIFHAVIIASTCCIHLTTIVSALNLSIKIRILISSSSHKDYSLWRFNLFQVSSQLWFLIKSAFTLMKLNEGWFTKVCGP